MERHALCPHSTEQQPSLVTRPVSLQATQLALGLGDCNTMLFSNLVHLKVLLMVLTAAVGTVAGGTMLSSYVNGGKAGPSFLLTVNPSTLFIQHVASLTSTVNISISHTFSGTV